VICNLRYFSLNDGSRRPLVELLPCACCRRERKVLSTLLGHASIPITLGRYGHLFPGSGDEAVALVDAYLETHE
jgi:hypothetical protein